MDLLNDLIQIGFTEYEAKVYLALLNENPATGYQLSKKSGVPRSMVYETLGRLQLRGAVLEAIEGRATLYRPLPPEVLLDRQEQEYRRLLVDLREGLHKAYTATIDNHVWSINNRSSIISYSAKLIREAQIELYMVLNDPDLSALREEIVAASARDVSVSTVLIGEGELDSGNVVRHPPLESELQGITGTLLVVADNAEALVAGTDQDATATVTRNPNLVLITRQFVWMELFTQRIYARLGTDLLEQLEPSDRRIFESVSGREGG